MSETTQSKFPEFAFKACMLTYEQNARSISEQTNCLYRDGRGNKCAIGHLIADEHYSLRLEGPPVSDPRVREALMKSGVSESDLNDHYGLMVDIQKSHDTANGDFRTAFMRTLSERQPEFHAELVQRIELAKVTV